MNGSGAVGTEDKPTIAGRALRALQAQPVDEPAPDEAPVAEAPVVEAPAAPQVVLDKPAPPVAPPVTAPAEPTTRSRLGADVLVSLVALTLAAAVAVAGLVVWLIGVQGKPTTEIGPQAQALAAARIGVTTLTTLDAKHAARDLDRWLTVTGGSLHKNIVANKDKSAAALGKLDRSTTGTVQAAAVTEFDASAKAPTATVIAAVQILTRTGDGKSSPTRNRYRVDLDQENGVWKILDLRIVPLELS